MNNPPSKEVDEKPMPGTPGTATATALEQLVKLAEKPGDAPLYTLHYRHGQNPYPMAKNFRCGLGALHLVIQRAKQHCDSMNLRFISVRPFISDLDAEEKLSQS